MLAAKQTEGVPLSRLVGMMAQSNRSIGDETLAAESPRSIRFPGRPAPLAIL